VHLLFSILIPFDPVEKSLDVQAIFSDFAIRVEREELSDVVFAHDRDFVTYRA
jgi:hypothetical protein